jgi:hypothetical protein
VDATSGSVIAGILDGWSCKPPGPVQFDGTYSINALAVNHSYKIYAEPLNGTVGPAEVSNATDPGWPPRQACVVPQAEVEFTAATLSWP